MLGQQPFVMSTGQPRAAIELPKATRRSGQVIGVLEAETAMDTRNRGASSELGENCFHCLLLIFAIAHVVVDGGLVAVPQI